MTQFHENVTWFPKIYNKLYDKKVSGILLGFTKISVHIFRNSGHIFKKLGHVLGNWEFLIPNFGNWVTISGNLDTFKKKLVHFTEFLVISGLKFHNLPTW